MRGLVSGRGDRFCHPLGCDCTGGHFFGNHPAPLRSGTNANTYASGFEHVARHLAKRGVRVVNCSPISALKCFDKMPIEDALPVRRTPDPEGAHTLDVEGMLGDEWRVHERG